MQSYDGILNKLDQETKARMKLLERNKKIIWTAMMVAGVGSISLTFNGEGDSGGIEYVSAYRESTIEAEDDEGTLIDLPNITISYEDLEYVLETDRYVPSAKSLDLRDAVVELGMDVINIHSPGWENNDGAYGTIIINPAKELIRLFHNTRIMEIAISEKDF